MEPPQGQSNTLGDTAQITNAESQASLERIGYGSCRTVWADPSRTDGIVLKRADSLPDRSISNESSIHKLILLGVSAAPNLQSGFRVNIPNNIGFMSPQDPKWDCILPRLPKDCASCEALVNERIVPMPRLACHVIAQKFWDGDIGLLLSDKRHEHCLIRPYLGRSRTEGRHGKSRFINLRNYPLHMDQIEGLDLPADEYAMAMADALSFLLWAVRVDASDVEFVLAPSRVSSQIQASPEPGIGSRESTPGVLGRHSMWLLDFDCCKPIAMNKQGIEKAAERFWRNDPYYPTPDCKSSRDERIWCVFKDRFLTTSLSILRGETQQTLELPEMWQGSRPLLALIQKGFRLSSPKSLEFGKFRRGCFLVTGQIINTTETDSHEMFHDFNPISFLESHSIRASCHPNEHKNADRQNVSSSKLRDLTNSVLLPHNH